MNRSRYIAGGGRFADEWQWALNNIDPFYTPVPNEGMSTGELTRIKTALEELTAYWYNQVVWNTNPEAIANSQAIADLEQNKLNVINDLLAKRLPTTTNGEHENTPPPTSQSKSWLPILLIAAAAFYFFTRKKNAA